MSSHFPQPDFQRMGFSPQMIEWFRWVGCAATAATGAPSGDFSTFGDQEGLGQAFDYQPPVDGAVDAFVDMSVDYTARATADAAFSADLGVDHGTLAATVARLVDDVQGLCALVETKDQEIAALREKIEDLECLSV